MQPELGLHLVDSGILGVGSTHGALYVLADDQRTCPGKTAPPLDELFVVGRAVAQLPIELRHVVVHPALVDPVEHVGIQVVVVLQAARIGARQAAAHLCVVVDAERTDTELDPRLGGTDAFVQHLDEGIDVVTPPFTDVAETIAVALESSLVGDGHACHGIGVEIVVDMEPVDVVAADDVGHYLTDVTVVLGQARVEENQSVVLKEAVGILHIGVHHGQLGGALRLGPERVDPGVQLHAPAVTLLNHPLQGVPIGVGSLALLPCQETAPRLVGRVVESVGLATYLEDDRIDAALLHHIELARQIGLHGIAGHALELPVDKLDPSTTELTLG